MRLCVIYVTFRRLDLKTRFLTDRSLYKTPDAAATTIGQIPERDSQPPLTFNTDLQILTRTTRGERVMPYICKNQNMIRRLFSFLLPINIHSRKSAISKTLEITWANGQLVLDSKNTNYSYGSLQRVLRLGLRNIGFAKVAAMNEILVLGVAGGSVIKTLTEEIGCKAHITGVEIDAEIIDVANEYFGLDRIPNCNIVIDDAFEFVLRTRKQYDLIVIDVFRDTEMPNFLFEKFFAERLGFILQKNGFILFNTMTLNGQHDRRNQEYLWHFDRNRFSAHTIPRIENHNEVIIIEKI